jgi:hypothetical protein
VLRRFTVADADDVVSLDADPHVMRFVTGGVPTSHDQIENEVLPAGPAISSSAGQILAVMVSEVPLNDIHRGMCGSCSEAWRAWMTNELPIGGGWQHVLVEAA